MRNRILTSWGSTNAMQPHTIISGEAPPQFENGSRQPDCEKLFWWIEAATWEEAMAIDHLRQGCAPRFRWCPMKTVRIYANMLMTIMHQAGRGQPILFGTNALQ